MDFCAFILVPLFLSPAVPRTGVSAGTPSVFPPASDGLPPTRGEYLCGGLSRRHFKCRGSERAGRGGDRLMISGKPEETPGQGSRRGSDGAFGAELRRWRGKRELSLAGLAELVNYSKGYLSKIENGDKPVTADLARRCDTALQAEGQLIAFASGPAGPEPEAVEAAARTRFRIPDDDRCPYRGMAAFDVADAQWFFGRERATAELVARLTDSLDQGGPVTVVAPSGAGKSSLLRAGLMPALLRGALPRRGSRRWPVAVFTPTSDPVERLAAAVAKAGGMDAAALTRALLTGAETFRSAVVGAGGRPERLVLLVDQFEEVFTLCPDPRGRELFLDAVCALARSDADHEPPAVVVLGVRADFYGRLLHHPELAESLRDRQVALGPMRQAEVRAAIVRPARLLGLHLEPGLVELLLRDLGAIPATGRSYEPGALPLLAHALLTTWQNREGGLLTVAGYELTGGIHAAVATTAERTYSRLSPTERNTARRVLLRLVQVGAEGGQARRRSTPEALREQVPDEHVDSVLEAFVRARLVTIDADAVEITHEVLLSAWPRLREWIESDRAGLHNHQRVTAAAEEWDLAGRDDSLLYRGARLAVALDWARGRGEPAPLVEEYLAAGAARQDAERHGARRQVRRLRGLALALALCLVLASTGGLTAWRQTRIAWSNELATHSGVMAPVQPETSLITALAAHDLAETVSSRSAVLSTQAQAYLGPLADHGEEMITALAAAPTGSSVATAGRDGSVRLWDLATRSPTTALPAEPGGAPAVAFNHAGTLLAVAGRQGTVTLYAAGSGAVVRSLPGRGAAVLAVGFDEDGSRLVTASEDGTATLWDVATGRAAATLDGHRGALTGAAFIPGGAAVALLAADGVAVIWDSTAGTTADLRDPDQRGGNGLAVSPDGSSLAVAGDDGTRLWDLRGRTPGAVLRGHTDFVLAVAFSPDGSRIATVGRDNTARVWDAAGHRVVFTLVGHKGPVNAVAFSLDGQTLITGSEDAQALLWAVGGAGVATARPVSPIRSASLHGDRLATSAEDGRVTLWDATDLARPPTTFDAHPGGVWAVAFSPDGSVLATGGSDDLVQLRDAADHHLLATLRGHTASVKALAFSPDGAVLASAGDDHVVKLWDVRRHRLTCTLSGHDNAVFGLAFSPDGTVLATGSQDDTVRLWDPRTCRMTKLFARYSDTVFTVAFSPDGTTLATGGRDNLIRLHPLDAPETPLVLSGHTGPVVTLRFTDATTLASGGRDGTARLWDVDDGELRTVLRGHTAAVQDAVPVGRTLLTSSLDGTVRAWGLDTTAAADSACAALRAIAPDRWRLLTDQPRDVCED
ncbi:helix-turn-helix domain-containing protein [Saccharothrix lopnurensis]|uniref:Helix-turn-helix domain-containing protein n=1 Tax=Saccharothrix lopnurensis TaxID=1670621 RepID=A0ABW1P844_9PSEU